MSLWLTILAFFSVGRYFRLTCKHQPCKPCEQEYLSCEDREDGLQSSPDQPLHFPKYITCDKGRKTDNGTCPYDAVWRVQSFPYMERVCSYLQCQKTLTHMENSHHAMGQ